MATESAGSRSRLAKEMNSQLGTTFSYMQMSVTVIDPEEIIEVRDAALKTLDGIEGFLSLSYFEDVESPSNFVSVAHYASPEAMTAAYTKLQEDRVYDKLAQKLSHPMEIEWLDVYGGFGKGFRDADVGEMCSISIRTASPGMGADLAKETADIFKNISAMQGFRGCVIGVNRNIQEQVIGICLWDDAASFEASIPDRETYEINLYQRGL